MSNNNNNTTKFQWIGTGLIVGIIVGVLLYNYGTNFQQYSFLLIAQDNLYENFTNSHGWEWGKIDVRKYLNLHENGTLNFDESPVINCSTINGQDCDLIGNAGTGNVTGSGTTNRLAKWTSTLSLGNSLFSDNGSIITSLADIQFNGDAAEAGGIRFLNSTLVCYESTPASTSEPCFNIDANENFIWNTAFNFINLNNNPLITNSTNPADTGSIRAQNNQSIICAESSESSTDECMTVNSDEQFIFDVNHSGSGVMQQPKIRKWGISAPGSGASFQMTQLLQSSTETGTETTHRDINGKASSYPTGVLSGNNAGVRSADMDIFSRDENSLFTIKFSQDTGSAVRLFAGFTALDAAPQGNNPLNNTSGVLLCTRSTDTTYQWCHNDGVGATVFDDTGISEATTTPVEVEIVADDINSQFICTINGVSTIFTTQIPTLAEMGYWTEIETSENVEKAIRIYYIYVENDL